MRKTSDTRSRRLVWRLALLMLVILPFLPEITVYVFTALAKASGCRLEDSSVCVLAGSAVSDIVDGALQAGLFVSLGFAIGFAAIWLALCYYMVNRGWSWTTSRLLLALLITAVFAVLPYWAPNLALAHVVNLKCAANGSSCFVFGGEVTSTANDVLAVFDEPFIPAVLILRRFSIVSQIPPGPVVLGAPIAAGAFLVYTIITIIVKIISRRRSAPASATQP
jgi:hypothetical protein